MEPSVIETADHSPALVWKTLVVFLTGLVVLAVFQSSALVTASYDLPPGALSEFLISLAEGWHGLMDKIGAAGVTQWFGEQTEELRPL